MPAVFVDVDDTLVRTAGSRRIPISATVERVRELHALGAELYLWSRGGAEYARSVAVELGLEPCFKAFLPKPELLVDDAQVAAWQAVEVHPSECQGRSGEDLLARLPRRG